MKEHSDNKRYMMPSNVKEGDTALIKRDDSKKKSDTPYDPRPHIIVEKKGSMVTAENDDGTHVTRNSSFFKNVPTAKEENATTEKQGDSSDVAAPMESDPAPLKRYPQHTRTCPVKLDDLFATYSILRVNLLSPCSGFRTELFWFV